MPKAPHDDSYPLAGIRVADFSRVLAGPFSTRMLADLGAEVVKIEPPSGDLSRFLGGRRGGISGYYLQQNCGKQNVSIDLKHPRGRELAAAIVGRCDVLVENFKPGVMDSLGLGPQALSDEFPRLIYCSLSGFGQNGPWKDRRAFAGIAHATTGTLHRQLSVSKAAPFDSVLAIGDTVAGLQATVAVLAALQRRQQTGRGQIIDMAMHDALLSVQECANFHLFGEGADENDFLCSWIYPCKGELVALPTDPRASWERFTKAMGRPQLASDERYDTHAKREQCLDELEAHIAAWVSEQTDADAVVAQLEEAGFPAARVASMAEALDCEHTASRAMTVAVDDRSGRTTRVLNSPYRFSDARAGVRGVAAYRGEDNHAVLEELLGLDATELASLEQAGVISARIPGKPRR